MSEKRTPEQSFARLQQDKPDPEEFLDGKVSNDTANRTLREIANSEIKKGQDITTPKFRESQHLSISEGLIPDKSTVNPLKKEMGGEQTDKAETVDEGNTDPSQLAWESYMRQTAENEQDASKVFSSYHPERNLMCPAIATDINFLEILDPILKQFKEERRNITGDGSRRSVGFRGESSAFELAEKEFAEQYPEEWSKYVEIERNTVRDLDGFVLGGDPIFKILKKDLADSGGNEDKIAERLRRFTNDYPLKAKAYQKRVDKWLIGHFGSSIEYIKGDDEQGKGAIKDGEPKEGQAADPKRDGGKTEQTNTAQSIEQENGAIGEGYFANKSGKSLLKILAQKEFSNLTENLPTLAQKELRDFLAKLSFKLLAKEFDLPAVIRLKLDDKWENIRFDRSKENKLVIYSGVEDKKNVWIVDELGEATDTRGEDSDLPSLFFRIKQLSKEEDEKEDERLPIAA